jgi:hypothetical protein
MKLQASFGLMVSGMPLANADLTSTAVAMHKHRRANYAGDAPGSPALFLMLSAFLPTRLTIGGGPSRASPE